MPFTNYVDKEGERGICQISYLCQQNVNKGGKKFKNYLDPVNLVCEGLLNMDCAQQSIKVPKRVFI